jgi:hypothetical protein
MGVRVDQKMQFIKAKNISSKKKNENPATCVLSLFQTIGKLPVGNIDDAIYHPEAAFAFRLVRFL